MANSPKRGFSYLKNWVRANQIMLINASFTVVLVGIIVTVLLFRATNLQRRITEESVINLAGLTAYEVQSNFLVYFNVVKNISQIMGNYETIEVRQRRGFFNDTMQSILNANPSVVSIYSIWKPDKLDGMDRANTDDTNATGQYNSGYTRERGWVEQRVFDEYKPLLELDFVETNGLNGIVSEPSSKHVFWRDVMVVDIQFPILTGFVASPEVIGVVGATINLEQLQAQIEAIRPYETGLTLLSTREGAIVAHSHGQLRGQTLSIFENIGQMLPGEDPDLVLRTMNDSIHGQDYKVFSSLGSLIVSYPLRSIGALASPYYPSELGNPPWAVITAVPMETILAPLNAMLRFSIVFIIGAGVLAALVIFLTSSSVTQHARNLQRSLEQSTTMQDNLKYGLFLMDQKFIIQGAYSKALERILSVPNLQGKNFIELIGDSVRSTEQEGIRDFFEMIFKKAYDTELLESINPINEFTYISTETGENKNLRTTFTLAEEGRGNSYILGTMEDVTSEKELEKQLLEAENLRGNEMKSLFQVIQLDPRVLRDFINDTEYEFERINDQLKNKNSLQRNVLIEMYQSIHAMKSNALILNLESFSERLHKLESSIKRLQEKYPDIVPFDDFLGLVLELNDTMKEIDLLRGTVSKIENFRTAAGGDKSQEKYVLVETLTRVCKKTQTALGKKVRFVAEEIDNAVLNYAPRREIKEVLTQLVRNAVYHGIETPEEREAAGKEPEGEIHFSLKYKHGNIVITLADNGKGIDFNKIRKTATDSKLLRDSNEANNKDYLLKALFSPGFSTLDKADHHAGRGIGLSLVKDRVKDLGGKIKVSTAAGKGTKFSITIPLELPAAVEKMMATDQTSSVEQTLAEEQEEIEETDAEQTIDEEQTSSDEQAPPAEQALDEGTS